MPNTNQEPTVRSLEGWDSRQSAEAHTAQGPSLAPWPTPYWPQGVARVIRGFDRPLYSLLQESARKYPHQVYTIFQGAEQTYAQVQDTADKVAAYLHSVGVQKGDRVAIFLPNLPHYPPIFFGILKLGGICVTCNPLYTATELRYQLQDAEAKVVFCMDHPQFYPTAQAATKDTDVETVVVCNIKSSLPKTKALLGGMLKKIPQAAQHDPNHVFLDHILAQTPDQPPEVEIDPIHDAALIIYTGGTTGVPKGAVLTHSNLVFDVMAWDEWVRFPAPDGQGEERVKPGGEHCYLGVLPWYHIFGMTLCLIGSCYSASRLICIPDPRAGTPPFTEVLKAVQRFKPTLLVAVPTIFSAFINHPHLHKFNLRSIRACASGGAPLPQEVAKEFEQKTGAIIFEGYGLSETAPVIAGNPSDISLRRFGSVGFPWPNTDIKIVDLDTGQIKLPLGEDGEIAVHGPQVMPGYWRKPQANAAVFREIEGHRYFLTGDIGHIDQDGYIVITDRKKDVILVGGFNCYPREVEEVLYEHPKVSQAAVVGIPYPTSGEQVKAFIQLRSGEAATEQEILDFCQQRLAGYKRPKSIEFRSELPTSAVGKVLRRVLRDEEMNKKK
ncbi:MAG: long-chain fatty acid--CoA ligase [Desulfovermiculus sp.]|nr:long-chain fatty acid--CoA ligase [Desulfovermiculus sp.]